MSVAANRFHPFTDAMTFARQTHRCLLAVQTPRGSTLLINGPSAEGWLKIVARRA